MRCFSPLKRDIDYLKQGISPCFPAINVDDGAHRAPCNGRPGASSSSWRVSSSFVRISHQRRWPYLNRFPVSVSRRPDHLPTASIMGSHNQGISIDALRDEWSALVTRSLTGLNLKPREQAISIDGLEQRSPCTGHPGHKHISLGSTVASYGNKASTSMPCTTGTLRLSLGDTGRFLTGLQCGLRDKASASIALRNRHSAPVTRFLPGLHSGRVNKASTSMAFCNWRSVPVTWFLPGQHLGRENKALTSMPCAMVAAPRSSWAYAPSESSLISRKT
jgi:hypothetical protein